MAEVELESVRVDGGAVEYEYRSSGRLRRFLSTDPFWVTYEQDVADVPDAILAVPWLANVCPVAWAAGADVVVPRLDRTFGAALDRVEAAMAELYPEFLVGGDVRGREVVDAGDDARFGDALGGGDGGDAVDTGEDRGGGPASGSRTDDRRFDGTALLFSGGVDSLTTYVRHREVDPTLIAIDGADIARENRDAWRRNRAIIESFAGDHGVEALFVETDMHGFLDGQQLIAHYDRYLDDTWWACVQHGLGLLGLCAPLCYARGIGDLFIAATHTEDFEEPWGSHPSVDDEVEWAATRCHHDGYELSRQEKIERLAAYVREEDEDLTVRACHESDGGGNCNDCEKCARTAVGLLLAGLDPAEHGYEIDEERVAARPRNVEVDETGLSFDTVRQSFESGDWSLGADERFMWEDLQAHADPDREYPYPGADEFVAWLATADFEDLVAGAAESPHREYLRLVARRMPYSLYRVLFPAVSSVQRLLARRTGN